MQKALQSRARAHLQNHPQVVPGRQGLHRGRDVPLHRSAGRDGLGHLQRLVPQAGHPLPRQLPHQVSLFYMREFLIYKPLITQKRFLRELSSRLSELLTSKYFFEVCKKHDDTSNQFCLSKSSLIGFEMDYFNQTVNLRHVASVDR